MPSRGSFDWNSGRRSPLLHRQDASVQKFPVHQVQGRSGRNVKLTTYLLPTLRISGPILSPHPHPPTHYGVRYGNELWGSLNARNFLIS